LQDPSTLPNQPEVRSSSPEVRSSSEVRRDSSSTSLRELLAVIGRRRRLIAAVEGGLLLACLLYCLVAPNQYEARARVALRTSPVSALTTEASGSLAAASILSAPLQQETLAIFLRSDQLAWRVIIDLKLYRAPAFNGVSSSSFPG